MNRMYLPTPDGYCGDEDNGQTSAWYVFSALGFYPVTPASNEYVLGAPLFKKAEISLDNGNRITISAEANSNENRYIDSATKNGKPFTENYLKHDEMRQGMDLKFEMTKVPNTKKGTSETDAPYSLSDEKN